MDPTANLKEQLELARSIVDTNDDGAVRLAELVLALHNWLGEEGGALPGPWAAWGERVSSCIACPTCGDEINPHEGMAL